MLCFITDRFLLWLFIGLIRMRRLPQQIKRFSAANFPICLFFVAAPFESNIPDVRPTLFLFAFSQIHAYSFLWQTILFIYQHFCFLLNFQDCGVMDTRGKEKRIKKSFERQWFVDCGCRSTDSYSLNVRLFADGDTHFMHPQIPTNSSINVSSGPFNQLSPLRIRGENYRQFNDPDWTERARRKKRNY